MAAASLCDFQLRVETWDNWWKTVKCHACGLSNQLSGKVWKHLLRFFPLVTTNQWCLGSQSYITVFIAEPGYKSKLLWWEKEATLLLCLKCDIRNIRVSRWVSSGSSPGWGEQVIIKLFTMALRVCVSMYINDSLAYISDKAREPVQQKWNNCACAIALSQKFGPHVVGTFLRHRENAWFIYYLGLFKSEAAIRPDWV